MKKAYIFYLFLCGMSLKHPTGTTYFISATGSGGNTGTSSGSPWNFAKVNSTTFVSGDIIQFNKGDVFTGTITITHGGSSGNPITYTTYGTGAAPVITGFTSVGSWTSLGGNKYISSSTVSSLGNCNMVTVNGVNVAMGRYPNTGYFTYTSPTSSTVVCSSLPSGTTDWTGAEAVIRKSDFHTDRDSITGHSSTTLTYTALTGATTGTGSANYGLFIQNDVRTLDAQNEWFYDNSTNKLTIYSTTSPSNVNIASTTNLLLDNGIDNITIDGLDFEGANGDGLYFGSSNADNIIIQNCTVNFCGRFGIDLNGASATLNNNTVSNVGGNGINYNGLGGTITSNHVNHCGSIPGQAFDANLSRGIHMLGSGGDAGTVQYNFVSNTGGAGISKTSTVATLHILNNRVDSCVTNLNDQGCIYVNGSSTAITVDGNIVSNAIGLADGGTREAIGVGIYCDELISNATITNNTSFGCSLGIKLHKASSSTVSNNTVYNSATAQIDYEDQTTTGIINHIISKKNYLVSKDRTQLLFSDRNTNASPNNLANYWDTLDSNYYARPISESDSMFLIRDNAISSGAQNYNVLSYWQSTYSPFDAHSHGTPLSITDVSKLRLEINPSNSPIIVSLGANYVDMTNSSYSSITIPAWRSAVLIYSSALSISSYKIINFQGRPIFR